MTEEQKRKQQAQVREFPETTELMDTLRTRLAEMLFQTPVSAKDFREELYVKVQALDALKEEMTKILRAAEGDKQIEEHLKRIAESQGIPATRQ